MFADKFHLLCSQVSVQEISWSSSDSSDYENVTSNNAKQRNNNKTSKSRKRKRKQKLPKNISNLDITFVNTTKEDNTVSIVMKSEKEGIRSPIISNTQHFAPCKINNLSTSPILTSKSVLNTGIKSPIIILKTASPKVSPKVRKKLFNIAPSTNSNHYTDKLQQKCKSTDDSLDRRKVNNNQLENFKSLNLTYDIKIKNDFLQENYETENYGHLSYQDLLSSKQVKKESEDSSCTIQETPEDIDLDNSKVMLKTSSKDLANKVKSYFESHFSSENVSQQTISDIPTPKNSSRTSDDIEIISTMTQVNSNRNSSESATEIIEPHAHSKKDKKLKYKKDGLAYRLDLLLKKQNASTSLWQHERFLAANSDFVIPKGEYQAFRICKVTFNYGIYLIEAMDLNDANFLLVINSYINNISHDSIRENAILKLYEPYKIMEYQSNCKLVLNVCKFEFMDVTN